MLGIVDTRQLDEDTVGSLALDGRFLSSGLVDAPADDLDRLIDRLSAPRFGRDGAEADRPRPVGGNVDRQVGIDLAQSLARSFDLVGFADREDDRIAFDIEPGVSDIAVAQRIANIINDGIEAVALGRGDIDLEQQIGPAAQIEPECHLLVRQPTRHLCKKGRAEEVRQRQQHTERAYCADQSNLPILEIQHRR